MLRSEEMTLCRILGRNDAARDIIDELGELGMLHFRDLNGAATPIYKRAFGSEARCVDEMSRQLDLLLEELTRAGLEPAPLELVAAAPRAAMRELQPALRKATSDVAEARSQNTRVRRAHNALREHVITLTMGGAILPGSVRAGSAEKLFAAKGTGGAARRASGDMAHSGGDAAGISSPLLQHAVPPAGDRAAAAAKPGADAKPGRGVAHDGLHVLAGTLPRSLAPSFARAVFRVSRGNCILYEVPVEEPLLGLAPDSSGAAVAARGERTAEPVAMAKNFVLLLCRGGGHFCAHGHWARL